ncbi:MAG: DUF2203 domain-containing protein [Candidatus Omnitrophota bacterium]|nr:DUF2203 domain-containing protein [Candidatus Omnitrophota bacterium]
MKTKLFTVEEADKLLPQVRRSLKEMRVCRDRVEKLEKEKAVEELSWLQPDGTVSPKAKEQLAKLDAEQKQQAASFEKLLREMTLLGAQLKDLDGGLVDFFTPHGEDLVYLCWKEGEARIRFWHDLESGFGGRRPLEELDEA